MAIVTYLKNATNEKYSAGALQYVSERSSDIIETASVLGISAGAIAGAMAEENTAYDNYDEALDLYAKSGIDPVVASVTLGVALAGGPAAVAAWLAINSVKLYGTTRSHEEWQELYEKAESFEGKPSKEDKILNPALIDSGPANFKIATAIDLVLENADSYPSLGLGEYKEHFDVLVADLLDPASDLTAKLYGLYLKEAEDWFKANGAYGDQWDSLPQTFRDALLVTFTNTGEEFMTKAMNELYFDKGLPYEPLPALTTGGGMNHLLNAEDIGNSIGLLSYGSDVQEVDDLKDKALIVGEGGLAARYALKQLRYVCVEGIDYSDKNTDGELNLYDPESGEGNLTENWITDRSLMLSTLTGIWIQPGVKHTQDTYQNPDGSISFYDTALYKSIIAESDAAIYYFGDKYANTNLEGGQQEDHLYGMGGDDTINGRGGNDYIEGGKGRDTMSGGDGNDTFFIMSEDEDYDIFNGGTGEDTIQGNKDGNTTIRIQNLSLADNSIEKIDGGGSGNTNILAGTDGNDTIDLTGITVSNINKIEGGAGNDTITGTNNADHIYGGAESDTLKGMGGDDFLYGGEGVDTYVINSGDGNDTIIDEGKNVLKIDGKVFAGVFTKEEGSNTYVFTSDNHTYTMAFGSDTKMTIDDDTSITFNNQTSAESFSNYEYGISLKETLPAIAEDHTFVGGNDDEYSFCRSNPDSSGQYFYHLGDGEDVVVNGTTSITVIGGGGDDELWGLRGSDHLIGGAGNDYLVSNWLYIDGQPEIQGDVMEGGEGHDIFSTVNSENCEMYGGTGNDLFKGGSGSEWMYGESGTDILVGDGGADHLSGGDGDDFLLGDHGASWANPDLQSTAERVVFTYDDENGWILRASIVGFNVGEDGEVHSEVDGNVAYFSIEGGNDFLEGGAGRDYLLGGVGDDTLKGDAGADTLVGGDDDDTLLGGEGNDLLQGDNDDQTGNGVDTLFGGAGNDQLQGAGGDDYLYGEADSDKLYGNAGHDHLFGGLGDDYLWGDDSNSISVGNDHLFGGGGNDHLQGGGGNDELYGGANIDTLLGQKGDDKLFGGDGNDVLGGGEDNDILYGDVGNDQLMGDAGADILYGGIGDDNLWGGGGDDTLLGGAGADNLMGEAGQNTLNGGDDNDAIWGGSEEDILIGGAGHDTLRGEGGEDTFTGGTGNDSLYGGIANDTYYFNLGDGYDRIYESGGNLDTLVWGEGISTNDIDIYIDDFDVRFVNKTNNDTVTVKGWNYGGRIESTKFADGTVWDTTYVSSHMGREIDGTSGADTLLSGFGNDVLEGGAGDDTYLFDLNNGKDVIYDEGGNDIIRFGVGIIESDIVLERRFFDLILGVKGTENQIRIENWSRYSNCKIENVEFADGGAWDIGELVDRTAVVPILGSDSDDTLWAARFETSAHLRGLAGNDILHANSCQYGVTLEGGSGDDTLYGSSENDTYLFNIGDGKDTISELYGVKDTIAFGEGISPGDISFNHSDKGTALVIGGGSDQIFIKDLRPDHLCPIENITFVDGTVWSDDFFSKDSTGDDTYLINLGDGNVVIPDSGGEDTIRFGEGITTDDIIFSRSGGDLLLGISGADNQVNLKYWGTKSSHIGKMIFADGTVWNRDAIELQMGDLLSDPIIATEGDDRLYSWIGDSFVLKGLGGADRLYGSRGNDILKGGAGNDELKGGLGNDKLRGGSGNDRLRGGSGNDKLRGDKGNDTFVFDTALDSSNNIDTITDFTPGEDKVVLNDSIFSALVEEGTLSSVNFSSNSTGVATDDNDYILYNTSTGSLLYDADGNGEGVATQFATLSTKPQIDENNFTIVAS